MTVIRALAAAFLAGMVIFSGCVREESGDSLPQNPVPSPLSPEPSVQVTGKVSREEGAEAVPVPFVPGRTYRAGEKILISGTTILIPGNPLLIEIQAVAFGPTGKTDPGYVSGSTAVVEVMEGAETRQNTWHYLLDTSGFGPGDYSVEVTGVNVKGFREAANFTIVL